MGKENIQIKRVFLNKICQAPNLYLTLSVLPIEFNSLKFSFGPFVFVEISELFLVPQGPQNDPKMNPNIIKTAKISNFVANSVNFSIDVVN